MHNQGSVYGCTQLKYSNDRSIMFIKKKIIVWHNTSNWNEHVVAVSSGGIVKTLQNISTEKHA